MRSLKRIVYSLYALQYIIFSLQPPLLHTRFALCKSINIKCPNQRCVLFPLKRFIARLYALFVERISRDSMLHYRRIPDLHIDRVPYSSLSLRFPHDLVTRTGTGKETSYSIFRFVLCAICPANTWLARVNEFRYGKLYSCLQLYRRVLTLAMSKCSLVRMKCDWSVSMWGLYATNITPVSRLILSQTKRTLS